MTDKFDSIAMTIPEWRQREAVAAGPYDTSLSVASTEASLSAKSSCASNLAAYWHRDKDHPVSEYLATGFGRTNKVDRFADKGGRRETDYYVRWRK